MQLKVEDHQFRAKTFKHPPSFFSPLLKLRNHFDSLPVLVTFAKGGQNIPSYLNFQLSPLFKKKKKVQNRIQQIWNYLPHPPPAIGGGLGPPPQLFIRPILRRGCAGGLTRKQGKQHLFNHP